MLLQLGAMLQKLSISESFDDIEEEFPFAKHEFSKI
jgi:hypothetical protein